MIYSVRSDKDGYHVNGDAVGRKVSYVATWFRMNAPHVSGVLRGACMLSRMDRVAMVRIQRTAGRDWHIVGILDDGTELKG